MNSPLFDALGCILGRRPAAMQVGALCLDPASGDVLLITSRGTGRWIIPKGWPMAGLSAAGAARQEAWEEAGVRGSVAETAYGSYEYDKIEDGGLRNPVNVQVHILRVDHLEDDFPEQNQRRRKWFPPARAAELVDEDGLRALLLQLGK